MPRAKKISGFDYLLGVPCEFTAPKWAEIRAAILARGGTSKRCNGEEWLIRKGHQWAFEIYHSDRAPMAYPPELIERLSTVMAERAVEKWVNDIKNAEANQT